MEWFEQIGVDFDIYFNTNKGMYDATRAIDPTMQLSDFFFSGQAADAVNKNGSPKDIVIFDGINGGNDFANTTAYGAAFGASDGENITYITGNVGSPIRRLKRGENYANGSSSNGFSMVGVNQQSFDLVDTLASTAVRGGIGAAALANPALTVGVASSTTSGSTCSSRRPRPTSGTSSSPPSPDPLQRQRADLGRHGDHLHREPHPGHG